MVKIIGITMGYLESNNDVVGIYDSYLKAVKKAKGIPLLLHPLLEKEDINKLIDNILSGIIISGGCDLDPVYFGQEPDYNLRRIDPLRDEFEINLVKRALNKQIPLLAICRGAQVLNVACGGSVIQNLEGGLQHDQNAPKWYPSHRIKIHSGSKLNQIFAVDKIRVNSFHHQGIGELGEGLVVSAVSSDGVIEAVEYRDHPFAIGVQWHPERMFMKYEEQLQLFNSLVGE